MSERKLKRSGVCRKCGQCCGAPGSPEQDSPWPNDWPESEITWQVQHLPLILQLTSTPHHGGAKAGQVAVGDNICYWIWVPGHGLCKDKEPFGDETSYQDTCPFLLEVQEDGTVPCAFIGTELEFIWESMCKPSPKLMMRESNVLLWRQRHPKCSFTWS